MRIKETPRGMESRVIWGHLTEVGGNNFSKKCLILAHKLHPVVNFFVFPVIFETTTGRRGHKIIYYDFKHKSMKSII